jgi:hypothetical protein
MKDSEVLERWKQIVGEIAPRTAAQHTWTNEPPEVMFHFFRPDGVRVDELFRDLDVGGGITERLMKIFEVSGPETGHMYFIPSKPIPLSDETVAVLAQEYIRNVAALANADADNKGDEEISALAKGLPVDIRVGPRPDRSPDDVHPLESLVYEIVTDYGGEPFSGQQLAYLLGEPLYYIACSYQLRYWVLWPLADNDAKVIDPFEPYFKLWAAGVDLSFDDDDSGEPHLVAYRNPTPKAT